MPITPGDQRACLKISLGARFAKSFAATRRCRDVTDTVAM